MIRRMARKNFYRQLARYSDLVFILPAAMGVGFGLGYILDLWWQTSPWMSLTLTLLGAAAGFYQVVKTLIGGKD